MIINSKSKLKSERIVLNGGNCEINERNDRDNDNEREHDRSCRKFKPHFRYAGTCTNNPLSTNLKIISTADTKNSKVVNFSVSGSSNIGSIKWKFDNAFESNDTTTKHNFIYPGKHLAQAAIIDSNGYFRKIGQYLNISPAQLNKGQIAIFQFTGSQNAPKQISAAINMRKITLTKIEQDPELYFTEMTGESIGKANIIIPHFNYKEQFSFNILPKISNPTSYINQNINNLESSLISINSTNAHILKIKQSLHVFLDEIRIKVDSLSADDKMKLATFLQANSNTGIATTFNQKFNIFDLLVGKAHAADIFSFFRDQVTVQNLKNFSNIILGVAPFVASSGAIAYGAVMAKNSQGFWPRLGGVLLAVGGAYALLLSTLDAISQTIEMSLPKEGTLFGQISGESLSNQLTNIKLRGTFIPVDSLPLNQSPLVLRAINQVKNQNANINKANESITLLNNSLALISSSSKIENFPLVTFPQTTSPGFLSPSYISSVTLINPLDGSALIQSFSTTGETVGVIIKSDKTQTVKVKLSYVNNDLKINQDIIVDIPVKVSLQAVINYNINKFQVDFDSIGNIDSNLTYLWNFGDGQTSTEKAPTHTYTKAGTYPVLLTVTDATGSQAATRLDINVTIEGNVTFCNVSDNIGTMYFQANNSYNFIIDRTEDVCECHTFPLPQGQYSPIYGEFEDEYGQLESVEYYDSIFGEESTYYFRGGIRYIGLVITKLPLTSVDSYKNSCKTIIHK